MNSKQTKVYILTLPLNENYGGMLQAYALQLAASKVTNKQVELLDCVAEVDSKRRKRQKFLLRKVKDFARWAQLRLGILLSHAGITFSLNDRIVQDFKQLIKGRCIIGEIKNLYEIQLDPNSMVIVGSDQVWRQIYASGVYRVETFFLDFLPESIRRRSFAYAASFGRDEWEGTSEETAHCQVLIKDFKAVSVREHSGVELCQKTLGVQAQWMPDPTLLLEVQDYDHIIEAEGELSMERPYIAAYILDESEEIRNKLSGLSTKLGMPIQHMMPHVQAERVRDRFPIHVGQWLRYIKEAAYVITDSFHGCVFSIIYNKPFICLGNKGRGSARFDSLFQLFHLESRLVDKKEDLDNILLAPIDWDEINEIHRREQKRGFQFLKKNLE